MSQHTRDVRTQRFLIKSMQRKQGTLKIVKELLKRCKNHLERKDKIKIVSENGTIKFTNKRTEMICFMVNGIDMRYEWKDDKWALELI